MPLKMHKIIEPLAGADAVAGFWIPSEAVQVLKREILRYINHEVRGRSLLIAGHRGAGKTAAVHKAIADLNCSEPPHRRFPRSLIVRIHGPDLLLDLPPKDCPAKPECQVDQRTRDHQKRHARREIVRALHRALCDEFVSCFEHWALNASNTASSGAEYDPAERIEIAAQIRLELDGEPDAMRLLQFWKWIGRMPGGILQTTPPGTLFHRQAFRELVAISTSIRVHHEIYEHEESESRADAGRPLRSPPSRDPSEKKPDVLLRMFAAALQSSHVVAPLLSVGIGIIVLVTLLKLNVPWTIAGPLGLLVALGASLLLNLGALRNQHYSLMASPTAASMNRMLPVLIQRVREAQLHPIFVVDELDKVDGLPEKMSTLMASLKHIVADQAFFCFLTDRAYYEETKIKRRDLAYPPEETFFGDLVLVHHTPCTLHSYLETIIAIDGNPIPEDHCNKLLLTYVTLYESKMHAGALRRYLSSTTNADGWVTIQTPSPDINFGYRFKTLVQLAVECVLDQPEMRDRLRQAPDNFQQVVDALYYPARRWDAEAQEIVKDSPDFAQYMKGRMISKTDTKSKSLTESDLDSLRAEMYKVVQFLVEPDSLYGAMIGKLFAGPYWPKAVAPDLSKSAFADRLAVRRYLESVLPESPPPGKLSLRELAVKHKKDDAASDPESMMRLDALDAFLLINGGGACPSLLRRDVAPHERWLFTFNCYGMKLDDSPAQRTATLATIVRIYDIDALIKAATGQRLGLKHLIESVLFLTTQPGWDGFAQAVDAYAHGSIHEEQQQRGYQSLIEQYSSAILANAEAIRGVIFIAWSYGRSDGMTSRIEAGLKEPRFLEIGLNSGMSHSDRCAAIREALETLAREETTLATSRAGLFDHLASTPQASEIENWLPPLRLLILAE